MITITTSNFRLTFNKSFGAFTPASTSVSLLVPPFSTWAPGAENTLSNLGGTRLDIGCYDTFEACYGNGLGWGPISRDGLAVWDDLNSVKLSVVPEPSLGYPWFEGPSTDAADYFVFAGGLDFRGAVADFGRASGLPPLPPAYAFGVWWSTWLDFSEGEVEAVVLAEYAARGLPLDALVLDMGWHIQPHAPNCSSWGGFSWNRQLFPAAEQWVRSLRAGASAAGRPLAVLLNGHPDDGIGPCEENYTAFSRVIGADPAVRAKYPCKMGNATWVRALQATMLDPKGLTAWWTDCACWGDDESTLLRAPFTHAPPPPHTHSPRRTQIMAVTHPHPTAYPSPPLRAVLRLISATCPRRNCCGPITFTTMPSPLRALARWCCHATEALARSATGSAFLATRKAHGTHSHTRSR